MQLNKSFNCGSYQLGSGHALCVTHGWRQVRDTNVKTSDEKANTHQAVHTPLQVWDREATNNHSCPITVQVPGIGKHECNLSTFHTLPWQEKPNNMTNLVGKLMCVIQNQGWEVARYILDPFFLFDQGSFELVCPQVQS